MSFLVDTDMCSVYMKGNRDVWQRFMQYRGQLHVSAITVGELFT
jgi:predicted nucleic acid-binding protein